MAAKEALRLPPLPTIREIIRLYGLRAKKQLAQNFLLDKNLTRKIARSGGRLPGNYVCEVGPGPGGISRSILESGAKQLVVIEKDERFIPSLQLLNEASNGRVRIFHGDVLKFNMDNLFPEELVRPWDDRPPDIQIIGNLPFNVSTPLIIKYLEHISNHDGLWRYGRVGLTLTFQKEVADRMVAQVNHEQRSRLSIMCQYLCKVQQKFVIAGKCFVPPPDVDVGVVNFVPLKKPRINVQFKLVEKLVRQVFHYRQKKCKRGLATLFPPDRPQLTSDLLMMSGVDPSTRSFELRMEDFQRLCMTYKHLCDVEPELLDYDHRSQENALTWRSYKGSVEDTISNQPVTRLPVTVNQVNSEH